MSDSPAVRSARAEPSAAGARRVIAVLLVLVGAFTLDVQRPARDQLSAKVLLGVIDVYQATLSRVFAATGANCRFEPTCSHYGRAVIEHYGTLPGVLKTVYRIVRCNPFTPDNTVDLPYEGWSENETQTSTSNEPATHQARPRAP